MNYRFNAGLYLLLVACLAQSPIVYCDGVDAVLAENPVLMIAHAGGGINGMPYTNSLEALDLTYKKGFRVFEMDFSLTTDNHLILLHDWDDNFKVLFGYSRHLRLPDYLSWVAKIVNFTFGRFFIPMDHETFMALDSVVGLTQIDVDGLKTWMDLHPDTIIVTDAKDDNLAVLGLVKKVLGTERIIPQIYHHNQFEKVKNMGFERIILTLYKYRKPPAVAEIVQIAKERKLFAITWFYYKYVRNDLAMALRSSGKSHACAHTVNQHELEAVIDKGHVDCIYTDFLSPYKSYPM